MVTLFVGLLRLSAFISTIVRPLSRVTHRSCRGDSTYAISALFSRSCSAWSRLLSYRENLVAVSLKRKRYSTEHLYAPRNGCRGGGCEGECFLSVVDPINAERLYEGMNMGIAYIAECNLRVIDLVDLEEHISVVIMGNIRISTRTAVPEVSNAPPLGAIGTGVTSPSESAGRAVPCWKETRLRSIVAWISHA